MAIIISHSHYPHVAFVSILAFQTFDQMIFGKFSFPGARWYVMTVWNPQMVRDQRRFGNHCLKAKGEINKLCSYTLFFSLQDNIAYLLMYSG